MHIFCNETNDESNPHLSTWNNWKQKTDVFDWQLKTAKIIIVIKQLNKPKENRKLNIKNNPALIHCQFLRLTGSQNNHLLLWCSRTIRHALNFLSPHYRKDANKTVIDMNEFFFHYGRCDCCYLFYAILVIIRLLK